MPRPARRGILRLLTLLTGIVFTATALLNWLNPNRHLDYIAAKAGTLIDGHVRLAGIDWGFDRGFWLVLEGLAIQHSTRLPTDIIAPRIYARAALPPLLEGKLVIEQVTIERPQVTYRLGPPAQRSDAGDDNGDGFHLPLSLVELSLHQGSLLLEDRISRHESTVAHTFDNIAITLRELATGQPLEFVLSADVLGDPDDIHRPDPQSTGSRARSSNLQLSGQLSGIHPRFVWRAPWLSATVSVNQLPLDSLNGYLQSSPGQQRIDGLLDGELNYQGDFTTHSETEALLDLSAIRYRNRQLWPHDMPREPLQVSARLHQQSGQLRLEQLSAHSGSLRITAETTLQQASRRLSDSVLSATVPLRQVAGYIPWPLLGDSAQALEHLLNGNSGVVTLHRVELPAITLDQPLAVKPLLSQTRARATVQDVVVTLGPDLPAIKQLHGELRLADNTLHGSAISATVGALSLPPAHFSARYLSEQPKIDATMAGPLNVRALPRTEQRQLLHLAGLEAVDVSRFELRSDVAVKVHYDHDKPRQWTADGHLDIARLRLDASAPNTTLTAQGQVHVKRRRQLNLLIPALSGRLNHAPFKLSGKLFGLGAEDLLAEVKLKLDNLQLQRLAPWLAFVRPSQDLPQRLAGRLSTDMAVYYRHDKPTQTRLRGPLSLDHGRLYLPTGMDFPLARYLPPGGLLLSQINASLQLSPQRYRLNALSLRANQQPLQLSGHLLNLQQPEIELNLGSPALDLDQLLPARQQKKHNNDELMATELMDAEQATRRAQITAEPTPQRALPALARQSQAKLNVAISNGRYRGESFDSLSLDATYRDGVIDRAAAGVNVAGGQVRADGSVDLRQLAAVGLKLDYQLEQIDLARLTRMLSADGRELASGQLSSAASLSSNTRNLKRHLRGDFKIRTGPGKIPNRSVAANTLFSILSVIRIQGLLSGDVTSGVAIDGLPYQELAVDGRFSSGGIELAPVELITPAFSSRAIGNVNLLRKDMDLDASITVLVTIDKLLGLIPLIGPAAADLTKVYLKISGPFSEPSVRPQPAEGLKESVQSILSPSFNTTLMEP